MLPCYPDKISHLTRAIIQTYFPKRHFKTLNSYIFGHKFIETYILTKLGTGLGSLVPYHYPETNSGDDDILGFDAMYTRR
jgi:hypothetical protein